MRTLILLRHAKSDRPPGVADHDRPLDARGRHDAPLVARAMGRAGLLPALALVSTARRTQETFRLAAPALRDPPHRNVRAIYEAEPEAVLAVIRACPADAQALLVVGHNPGLHALAVGLAGSGEATAMRRLAGDFPTCAVAALTFATQDWGAVAPGAGTLSHFFAPGDAKVGEGAAPGIDPTS